MKYSVDQLLKLYDICSYQERFFIDLRQTRVAYYTSIMIALVTATITALMINLDPKHYPVLALVPIFLYCLADIGKKGTLNPQRRFLESITIRAKIESDLGLDNPNTRSGEKRESMLWPDEPFLPKRYMDSRNPCNSSSDFIDMYYHSGYWESIKNMFRGFQLIAVILELIVWLYMVKYWFLA